MQRFGLSLLLVLMSLHAFSQKKKEKQKQDIQPVIETPKSISEDSLHIKVFRLGMRYGDYQVAANALYHLMALQPNNAFLKDSLVLLYSGMGNSVQSILIAREVLQKNPENIPVLTAMAMNEQRLGLYKEALASYELLYTKTQ